MKNAKIHFSKFEIYMAQPIHGFLDSNLFGQNFEAGPLFSPAYNWKNVRTVKICVQ